MHAAPGPCQYVHQRHENIRKSIFNFNVSWIVGFFSSITFELKGGVKLQEINVKPDHLHTLYVINFVVQ